MDRNERAYRLVIMSAGGVRLEVDQILDVPGAKVVSAEVVSYERSGCASLLIRSPWSRERLEEKSRRWAAGRGWTVTVASLGGHD